MECLLLPKKCIHCYNLGIMQESSLFNMGPSAQHYPEVIDGIGKTPQQIANKMMELSQHQPSVLAVRIPPMTYAAVRKLLPGMNPYGGSHPITRTYETNSCLRLVVLVWFLQANELLYFSDSLGPGNHFYGLLA